MSTNAIGATDPSSQAASLAAAAGTASSGANTMGKTDFLNLLVTQLKNQDPTQPQDDSAFASQLAQFSSLEQLQNANQTLTQISTILSSVGQTAPSTTSTTGAPSTDSTTSVQ